MGAKDKKKWFLAGMICLMMWLLCGCMGNNKMSIDTTLEVNRKFKGQREMSAVVSESVFRQAFNSDLEELQRMVTERCPSTLLCSAEKVNNGVEITMTLEFASLSDYMNKIGQILGKTPGIYYDTSNSIFKDGYMLQENFTSQDLFGWLLDALKDKNSEFGDMELSDIFQNGDTKVIYDGETIDTEAMIHVEKMESHAFDSLSVEMTMNDDGSYKVAVNFIVNQDTYYDMGDDMDMAIKKLMPDGGVYDVNNVNEQRVYTIGFSAYNTETLISQLNSVLQTKNCEFEVAETGDESDPFRAHKEITIYLDGSYFLDFAKEGTELVYLLKTSSEYSFNDCQSVTGFLKNYSFDNDDKYTSVYMNVGPSDKVQISLTYAIDIQKIEIGTNVNSETALERTLSFFFDVEQAALTGENFESKLRARMDEGMTLESGETDGMKVYTVRIQADSPEDLSLKTTKFLDGSANEEELTSILTGGKSSKKQLKIRSYTYEDHIDLEKFLGSAVVSDGIVYRMEYPKGYVAAFEEGGHADMVTEGNRLTCTTRDPVINVQSRGETTNVAGVTQLLLWWVSLILTFVTLILNLKHIAGYIRYREKYLLKTDLFHGKNQILLTLGVVSLTIFVFTSLRLIFRVY